MKETGIIMSGDHPRLVLEKLKTMTRRTAGLNKINENPDDWYCPGAEYREGGYLWQFENHKTNATVFIKCPYGQVGDRLWVRETWRVESFMDGDPLLFGYKDGSTQEETGSGEGEYANYEDWYERICIQSTEDAAAAFEKGLVRQDEGGIYHWDIGKSPCRWRPSIHMPRWASRELLEITGLRVERLSSMSESDAHAEGVDSLVTFMLLWGRLNKKRGYEWTSNCWVWVITFKLCR